jgi:anti-sigma factor RsiW
MKQWLQKWLGRQRLTCEDVNQFLTAYLDGALDARTQAAFEVHLRTCADCQAYLDQYRKTIELAKKAKETTPVPEALIEQTLAFLRERLAQK